MYDLWNDLLSILPGLAALLWLVAGYRVGRLTYRPTAGRLRRSARIVIALTALAAIPVVALLVAIERIWQVGWLLAASRVTVLAPALLCPLVAVAVLAVPRLIRLARRDGHHPGAPPRRPVLGGPVQRA